MIESFLINMPLHTIDEFCNINSIDKNILIHSFFVVKAQNGDFKGILSSSDLLKKPHIIVGDCISKRPEIQKDFKTDDALKIIQSSGYNELPVFIKNEFCGVICKNDIIEYLKVFNEKLNIEIERKTKELLVSEEKYRELFEANTDGIAVFYINETGRPSNFVDLNENAAKIIGYSKDEVLKLNPLVVETKLSDEQLQSRISELQKNGNASFETKIFHKNGHLIEVEIKAVVINYYGQPAIMNITSDITERKKVEQALKESETNYINLANSGNILVWRSGTDKLCNYFNQVWLNFTGRTLAQEMGNGWADGVHPEDFQHCLDIYVKAFDKREKFSMDYRLRHFDGEYRWIVDDGSPIYNSKDEFIGYLGQCYDITERKEAELIIYHQNQELKKLNADKDRFITILAHDLKNPFNSILGFLSLLATNIRIYDIDKIEKQILIINKSAKNTYDLLEDILLWVRANSGKIPFEPQNQDFSCIFNYVTENLKQTANNKSIKINQFALEGIKIFADTNMLNTILRNLISNAIKFTNSGGTIDIYAITNHSKVTITISDNGIGINRDKLAKLFDISQVYTTKGTADESGTGLGLLLCKDFVEKHGCKIWVESEVGKGSDFKFTMPLCHD